VPESSAAATDLDLISYLQAIPDARMRLGIRFPAWYLLLVALLGILSRFLFEKASPMQKPEGYSQAGYATGENHEPAVL
jgi:hypothetical protein